MVRNSLRKVLGMIMAFSILVGMMSIGTISADAAESAIDVTIVNVAKRYEDAKELLDLINEYRKGKGLTNLVMDEDYLDKAMLRGAELSIYASKYCPNGKNGNKYITGATSGGQIIGYDIRSLSAFLTSVKNDEEGNVILLTSTYKSVGVGVVSVNGYKYACILASSKTPTEVNESVFDQTSVVANQTVSVLPSLLSDVSMPYSNGQGVYCGSSLQAYLKVTNTAYPTATVLLAPDNATVTLSNSCFTYKYDKVYAVSPGSCVMTFYFNNATSVRASCSIKAVARSFSSCTFSTIPDQYYTGSAIKPTVTITDSSGNVLTQGTDYTLSYTNNINIGTATVTVSGIGKYAGESKTMNFRIVESGATGYFGITVVSSLSTMSLGQSSTMTVTAKGGTSPITYKFEYQEYGTSTWTKIQSSTSNVCTFKPKSAVRTYVKVTATDSAGSTATQTIVLKVSAALVCNASLSSESVTAGTVVKATASCTGGVAPVEYAFYLQEPSSTTWTTLSGYSTTATVSFTPTISGVYNVCAKAKGASGAISKVYMTLTVTGGTTTLTNTSKLSASTIVIGNSVKVNCSASGGKSPYTYAVYYKKSVADSYMTVQNYHSNSTVTIKPAVATSYNVVVMVKDANGSKARKEFTLTVAKDLVNKSKLSANTVALGNSVTLTGAASGGTSPYQYAYYYKKSTDSSYTTLKTFSTKTTATLKPASTGTYNIVIKVKDNAGTIARNEYTLTVTSTIVNSSKLSATSITLGNSVTLTGAASGGTSPYQYAFYYKKSTDSSYTTLGGFTTTKTATLKPTATGTYNIVIKVKDSAGSIARNEYTLKVT